MLTLPFLPGIETPAKLIWEIPAKTKSCFLTFDDGPVPGITGEVLDILKEYNVKATFFCVGENVAKYPLIYQRILDEGHKTGNHTYNHLNGWKTPFETYIENVEKCAKLVSSDIFRPPYGKMTPGQLREIRKHYFIILWSVLSRDYILPGNKEDLLDRLIFKTKPGAVTVFHDSEKAGKKMLYLLPRYLKYLKNDGYRCMKISRNN